MLTLSLNFTTGRLIPLDKALILDAEVLDLVVTLLELDLHLMALILSSLLLADKDVLVNLDFLLTLLHRHLELILPVLETVDFVSSGVNLFTEALNFKLHDIVLNERLLLSLDYRLEVAAGHLVLKLEFTNDTIECAFFSLDLGDDAINIPALVLELLVRCGQELQIFLGLFKLLAQSIDFLLKLSLFFFRTNTLHSVNFTLHLLNLEILSVNKLLLSLLLNLQLSDVSLEVARGRQGARNITDKISLVSSKFEQLLRFLEKE